MSEIVSNIAIFCDFENIAIGARDAKIQNFDISLVIGRLLDKGSIVVKKAYADWENFKSYRRAMHEASFELIEIPHVSYSGKNSADIRMVVDALDLCYTKPHVDLFVICTGDSDFSPLVSKLRENNKKVIGIGVKTSTSGLLVSNCDEYIYYDDLARAKRGSSKSKNKRKAELESSKGDKNASEADRKQEALELILETVEALFRERDSNIWGSFVKQVLKRKHPNFSESFYGYRNFTDLLNDAAKRDLLEIEKDEQSGGYVITGFGAKA